MTHRIQILSLLSPEPVLSIRSIIRSVPALIFLCSTLNAQRVGTLIVAHGAGGGWDQQVYNVAAAVRTSGPVEVAFLMGPNAGKFRLQDQIAKLRGAGAERVVVVPLFVSSFSEHMDQLRYALGMTDALDSEMLHHLHMAGIEPVKDSREIALTPSIDDSPELAEALADRVRALVPDASKQAVLLFGHGPNSAPDYAKWMVRLRRVADGVRAATGARDVQVELVRDDAEPEVRQEAVRRARDLVRLEYEATGKPVIVVPVLVATGAMSKTTLKNDLAGLPIIYSGDAILPGTAMVRWVERRVAESATTAVR